METSRRLMVAGNWKMNGDLTLLNEFINGVVTDESIDTVICPPAIFLLKGQQGAFSIGAQDCSALENGAHTGDLSVSMLKEAGVSYVICGHSERRQDHNESDQDVAQKVSAVLQGGLIPIFCIGESLDTRKSGQLFEFLEQQIDAVVTHCGSEFVEKGVLAYEPIWAIGTGETATPEQAQEVHAFIRDKLSRCGDASKIQLLYGGSVNPGNAEELFSQPDIDGGLVGGASMKLDSFNALCQIAQKRN